MSFPLRFIFSYRAPAAPARPRSERGEQEEQGPAGRGARAGAERSPPNPGRAGRPSGGWRSGRLCPILPHREHGGRLRPGAAPRLGRSRPRRGKWPGRGGGVAEVERPRQALPSRTFLLQPALSPLSVPSSAPRRLPEPSSGVPGAPAGRDTKGCVEEGFVRSHAAAQPVSAERGGGAGPPPLPGAEELGNPGPPLGAWGRAGDSPVGGAR